MEGAITKKLDGPPAAPPGGASRMGYPDAMPSMAGGGPVPHFKDTMLLRASTHSSAIFDQQSKKNDILLHWYHIRTVVKRMSKD